MRASGRHGIGVAVALAFLTVWQMSGAAWAQSFYDRFIAPRAAAAPCYAYVADPNAPPEQRQRLRTFLVQPAESSRAKPPRTFRVALRFTIADADDNFAGEADCETVGQLARCTVPGDGGRFTLAPLQDGLRLTIGNKLELPSASGFSPDLADGRDVLIFALAPGEPAACGPPDPV